MTKRAHLLAALAALLLALLARTGVRAQDPTPTLAPPAEPVMGSFDPASVETWTQRPADHPGAGDTARATPVVSLAGGAFPRAIRMVGDCLTEDPAFLYRWPRRGELGRIRALEATRISTPRATKTFGRKSQAARAVQRGVRDRTACGPTGCSAEAGETPAACELRRWRRRRAIMLG